MTPRHAPGESAADTATQAYAELLELQLARMPPSTALALRRASIPHWLDDELLIRLAMESAGGAELSRILAGSAFARQDVEGRIRFASQARTHLFSHLRRHEPAEFAAANRAALDVFVARAESASVATRPTYELEVLYHLMLADESAGLVYLARKFETALWQSRQGFAEGLLARATEHESDLSDRSRMWISFWQGRLRRHGHVSELERSALRNLATDSDDAALQAAAQWVLGTDELARHAWSDAIRRLRSAGSCLDAHSDRSGAKMAAIYRSRLCLSTGDAYRDLANRCGGFVTEVEPDSGPLGRQLQRVAALPFASYRWLVRRSSSVPNWWWWHLGLDYQDWIIAHLVEEAIRWYGRAEADALDSSDDAVLNDSRIALAELQHHLGRWSAARKRYREMSGSSIMQSSPYRSARVDLGHGRAHVQEGDFDSGEKALAKARHAFERMAETRAVAEASLWLGRAHEGLGRGADATCDYLRSINAYTDSGDTLAATQVAWNLREPATDDACDAAQREMSAAAQESLRIRQYLSRFPDRLLILSRRWALGMAVPLAYGLTVLILLTVIPLSWITESLWQVSRAGDPFAWSLKNGVVLAASAILPVVAAVWSFRFIYALVGMLAARTLARRVVDIEAASPALVATTPSGMSHLAGPSAEESALSWRDTTQWITVEYQLWRTPLDLFSYIGLRGADGVCLRVDAITSGYHALKQDLSTRLEGCDAKRLTRRFVIFDPVWSTATAAAAVAVSYYMVSIGAALPFAGGVAGAAQGAKEHTLPMTTLLGVLLPTLLLLFPVAVQWRLVAHEWMTMRLVGRGARSIPLALLILATTVWTILLSLWVTWVVSGGLRAVLA